VRPRPTLRSARVDGSGTTVPDALTTMLSRPTGLLAGMGLKSTIWRVSITSVPWGFDTVAKFPNVFGTVPDVVNTIFPSSRPVKVYGMGVMLEYRSMELKLK
jgi:hypothetical protein